MTLLLTLLLIARMDGAVVGPNPYCEWTQSVETPNDLKNYTWKYYLDGAGIGMQFYDVNCTQTSVDAQGSHHLCSARLPVTIPGQHQVYIITTNTVGFETADSPPSSTTQFYIQTSGLEAPNSILIKKQDK